MPENQDIILPTIYDTPEYEMIDRLIEQATKYPQAFRILPIGEKPDNGGTWAQYKFDGTVTLWVNTSHPVAIDQYREIFIQKKERTMTTALTQKEADGVYSLLRNQFKTITQVLPKHLTPERLLRLSYIAITQSPDLARGCSEISLVNAIVGAAVVGLEIGPPLNLAHVIPFNNSITKKKEATLILDYKGLIELMYKSPVVKSIQAHAVWEGDDFDYEYGTNAFLRHRPVDNRKRGKLLYGYCVVSFITGGHEIEVVNEEQAMIAKNHSKAKNSKFSPWNSDTDEWTMWVKTAVRRISNRIPKSPDYQKAIVIEKMLDEQEGASVGDIINAEFTSASTPVPPPDNGSTVVGNGANGAPPKKEKKPDLDVDVHTSLLIYPGNLGELPEHQQRVFYNLQLSEKNFEGETAIALKELEIIHPINLTIESATKILNKIFEVVDLQNQ